MSYSKTREQTFYHFMGGHRISADPEEHKTN